jgi:1-aminocyclopropane-1-carboxylate synthase
MVAKDHKPFVLLSDIATSSTHGEDSPYFAGWRAYDDDPYDSITNPSGVIQMGLAENQVHQSPLFFSSPSPSISVSLDY